MQHTIITDKNPTTRRCNFLNIAVFASHNGSDLQAIIDACKSGKLNAKVCAVLSNNKDSRALQRARDNHIDDFYVSSKVFPEKGTRDKEILKILDSHQTDLVFLAGYLKKIDPSILHKYNNRIFNIHPALLPKYGGKGMYGLNVHRAVINAKEKQSGVTIHRVNEEYDEGEIVARTTVDVSQSDTPESLAAKILEHEHVFIVEVLNDIIKGAIPLGHSL
jgi:phosphoribosylglycinamide formyltransferase-1